MYEYCVRHLGNDDSLRNMFKEPPKIRKTKFKRVALLKMHSFSSSFASMPLSSTPFYIVISVTNRYSLISILFRILHMVQVLVQSIHSACMLIRVTHRGIEFLVELLNHFVYIRFCRHCYFCTELLTAGLHTLSNFI